VRELGSDAKTLCEIADVSKSGYYKCLKISDLPDKDYKDFLKVKEVFDQGRGKYGWRSIKMRLPDMNHKKIQRIMRKYGLHAKVRRKNPYKAIMKKTMEHRTFENKLQREFHQTFPFNHRFVYLSVIKDVASGEVVAWNLSLYLEMTLVTETIKNMKLNSYNNIMIHSDQGFHYTNPVYIEMVKELNMIQSMSGKGNCIDNAPIESFFGHMKDELDYQVCKTFEELRLAIEKYMRYYNQERKQWERKKMTPVEYRNHLLAQV
jgi:putative transposase